MSQVWTRLYNLLRMVTSLLKHGADVNIGTSEYRWTPLHLASRCVETCKVYVFYIAFIFISSCNDNGQIPPLTGVQFLFGFGHDVPQSNKLLRMP